MSKHMLTDIMSTSSLTEISHSQLKNFLNFSSSDSTCSSKCKTLSTSSSSSSSSSSSDKHNSRKHRKNKSSKSKHHKSKCASSSSTYTTTGSSGSCLTKSGSTSCSNSSSNPCSNSNSNSSSNTCSNSSSKYCNSRKPSCNPWELKCNTYKSLSGTILIPGPQGPSSGSLANFSGINNEGYVVPDPPPIVSDTYIYFVSPNLNYVNITPNNNNDTFTFGLSGKYLLQYNVYVFSQTISIEFRGTVNGASSSSFGTQNISAPPGSYGCSIIQDLMAGDSISLVLDGLTSWNFASLTIIKL